MGEAASIRKPEGLNKPPEMSKLVGVYGYRRLGLALGLECYRVRVRVRVRDRVRVRVTLVMVYPRNPKRTRKGKLTPKLNLEQR